MSNPQNQALFGLTAQSTGAFVNAAGTFANTRAKRQAAQTNAAYAELQARDALDRAGDEEQRHRRGVSQLRGRQQAALAARGVVLTEGSPLAILEATEILGEGDAQTIRQGGQREAFGRRVQAAGYRAEADASNPWLAAGSSLLSSAGTVADRWYQYKQNRKT
jgi:hypothetical protein